MDEKTQYKILQRKDANFFLAMGGWGWVMGVAGGYSQQKKRKMKNLLVTTISLDTWRKSVQSTLHDM